MNCVYGSLRIVLLTIQELSKAQCNYTDNNNNDYSDTDPFLSDLKNMMRFLKWQYNEQQYFDYYQEIFDVYQEILD